MLYSIAYFLKLIVYVTTVLNTIIRQVHSSTGPSALTITKNKRTVYFQVVYFLQWNPSKAIMKKSCSGSSRALNTMMNLIYNCIFRWVQGSFQPAGWGLLCWREPQGKIDLLTIFKIMLPCPNQYCTCTVSKRENV